MKCELKLNQYGVLGKKKTIFSTGIISQPFEMIDSVYVQNSMIDKILGGKTIAIRSASSCVKLRCIENAEEFLNKTLEELKKFKESVASSNSGTSTSSDNTMETLLKLKTLLDQGLITQEEFDKKRKSLVDKM